MELLQRHKYFISRNTNMVSTELFTVEMEHKMLKSIKKFLQGIFSQPSDFESFIAGKNPQSAAEVDHWEKIYSRRGGDRYGI